MPSSSSQMGSSSSRPKAAVGVTGVSGADEDLLAFTPRTLGATTSGSFSLYFDGSDVGLSTSARTSTPPPWTRLDASTSRPSAVSPSPGVER